MKTLLLAISLAISLGSARAAELQVFAAASLTDALQEIGRAYEQATGDKLRYNFAASSTLTRQIQEGAPADLFCSADEEKMDALQKRNLILADTRRSLLSNRLVIIIHMDSRRKISVPADLAKPAVEHLALAEPQTVPVGIYAKKYLQHIGLWSRVMDKVVPTENVRGTLAAVESGNVEAGIVYQTDAAISKKVRVAYQVPEQDAPKISYPFAVVRDTKQAAAARKFLAYLETEPARRVFEKFGFIVLRPAP